MNNQQNNQQPPTPSLLSEPNERATGFLKEEKCDDEFSSYGLPQFQLQFKNGFCYGNSLNSRTKYCKGYLEEAIAYHRQCWKKWYPNHVDYGNGYKYFYKQCSKMRYCPLNNSEFEKTLFHFFVLFMFRFSNPFGDNNVIKYCYWTTVEWLAMYFNLKEGNQSFIDSEITRISKEYIPKRTPMVESQEQMRVIPFFVLDAPLKLYACDLCCSRWMENIYSLLKSLNKVNDRNECVTWITNSTEKDVINILWEYVSPWRYFKPEDNNEVKNALTMFMLLISLRVRKNFVFPEDKNSFKQFRVIFWEIVHWTATVFNFYDPEDSSRIVEAKDNNSSKNKSRSSQETEELSEMITAKKEAKKEEKEEKEEKEPKKPRISSSN